MLEDCKNASIDELITSHLRLVPSVINKSYPQDHHLYDDLVQAGNIALMTAAKNFDPENGVRFSSYAIPYIQMCIMNYMLDNKADIRVLTSKPIRKAFFNRRKYKTATGELNRELMANELNINVSDIREMEQRISQTYISIEQAGAGDDSEDTFQIPDIDADPTIVLQQLEFNKFVLCDIHEAVSILNDRERFIIENRHFVDDPMKLQDLSIIFNVSIERIRQIEKAALKKLKTELADKFEAIKE